eukprot:Clim_evm20s66 gene=Clim_evmTU20s66
MVKFGAQLASQAVQDWAEYYLDYKGLRKQIKAIKKAVQAMGDYTSASDSDDNIPKPQPPPRGKRASTGGEEGETRPLLSRRSRTYSSSSRQAVEDDSEMHEFRQYFEKDHPRWGTSGKQATTEPRTGTKAMKQSAGVATLKGARRLFDPYVNYTTSGVEDSMASASDRDMSYNRDTEAEGDVGANSSRSSRSLLRKDAEAHGGAESDPPALPSTAARLPKSATTHGHEITPIRHLTQPRPGQHVSSPPVSPSSMERSTQSMPWDLAPGKLARQTTLTKEHMAIDVDALKLALHFNEPIPVTTSSDEDDEPAQPSTSGGPLVNLARPGLFSMHSSRHGRTVQELELQFYEMVKAELTKINDFYLEKLSSYQGMLDEFVRDAGIAGEMKGHEVFHVRRSFIELYRYLNLLSNFCILNYTAFSKIIKKHDKNGIIRMKRTVMADVGRSEFSRHSGLDRLIKDTEEAYSNAFEDGDIVRAKASLLVKQREHTDWDLFVLGAKFGAIMGVSIWALYMWIQHYDQLQKPEYHAAFPVFASVGLLYLMTWLWGATLYVWTKARINYVYLLELDPRTRLTFVQAFGEATRLSLVYFACLIAFFAHAAGLIAEFIPAKAIPVGLLMYTLGKFFLPLTTHWASRKFLLDTLVSVFISPFGRVRFVDFYVADFLTSMVKIFALLLNAFLYVFTGHYRRHKHTGYQIVSIPWLVTLLVALPLWFRFMQCLRRYYDTGKRWPNLPNAVKYALSLCVILYGQFHPEYSAASSSWNNIYRLAWMGLMIISTLYSFWWDINVDWGLRLRFSRKTVLTISRGSMFGAGWRYLLATIADFILRFFWTMSLIPNTLNPFFYSNSQVVPLLYAFMELLRRTMWGWFRMENEHVNNVEGYREVTSIPLRFETPTMDNDAKLGKGISKSKTIAAEIIGLVTVTIISGGVAYLVDQQENFALLW